MLEMAAGVIAVVLFYWLIWFLCKLPRISTRLTGKWDEEGRMEARQWKK